jgi:hypothetical protein
MNDIRLSSGKPTLGFLNPFIYNLDASAFNGTLIFAKFERFEKFEICEFEKEIAKTERKKTKKT